jgi:O-antigen/teichoic acid export membrane protein
LFVGIYKFQFNGEAYLKTSYVAIIFFICYLIYVIHNLEINLNHTKKYFKLYRKLLISSSTLVISNFANMMFLYTDIFVLSQVSSNPNQEIADFSFALNISSILLLIPLTLVQVDIEKLKKSKLQFNILNKKINNLLLIVLLILFVSYIILIKYFIVKYDNTLNIFIVLLIAKYFHAKSSLYGTYILILKKFNTNLLINFLALLLNIIACYYSYKFLGILGLSISSLVLLLVRFLILKMFKNYFSNKI